MSKSKPVETPSDMVVVKTINTPKLSPRAQGELTYQVGYVSSDGSCHLQIMANTSGGYFSKEWVPLSAIESCLTLDMKKGESFATSALKSAFISQSQNNAGFMGAVMVSEGLLNVVPDKSSRYVIEMEFWKEWKRSVADEAVKGGHQDKVLPAAEESKNPILDKKGSVSEKKAKLSLKQA